MRLLSVCLALMMLTACSIGAIPPAIDASEAPERAQQIRTKRQWGYGGGFGRPWGGGWGGGFGRPWGGGWGRPYGGGWGGPFGGFGWG